MVLGRFMETPGFGVMGAERAKLHVLAISLGLLGIWLITARAWPRPVDLVRHLERYPRIGAVALGLAMTAAMLFLVELLLLGANELRAAAAPTRVRDPLSSTPTVQDPVVGYRPLPGAEQRDRMVLRGAQVYDVTYTIDTLGHRVVPASTPGRTKALVFFGCSYAFGVGCNDEETLPNQVALLARDRRVYNLAYGGYGPHQMLAMMEDPGCLAFVGESKNTMGIYVFIRRHVTRVVPCVPLIQRPWIRIAPCYRLDSSGQPSRLGLFPNAIPWRVAFYDLLGYDQVREFLDINYPLTESAEDIALTAKVVRAAAERFAELLPGADFKVLLYPSLHDSPASARECAEVMEREGLKIIDMADMFADDPEPHMIPGDGHPTPATHKAVAEALVRTLNLAD